MSIREQIFNIPDLVFSEEMQDMTDEQWDEYVDVLQVFIITFPTKEMKLKSSLNTKNMDVTLKLLVEIQEMLRDINAFELADECSKRLYGFDKSKPERIESYVAFLLSSVTALSLDIQMALTQKESQKIPVSIPETTQDKRLSKSILAVDDDVYCIHLFKAALKDVPCKIIAANSGKEALNMLNKIKPHLFVLDIDMPGMNGIELAKILRKQGQYAPIIFLTGNATMEYVQECLQVGVADFIVKPINPQNVASRIQKYL
ncbi:MAG: response regulator [Candidatus Cloacimonetes bacterium]|nr:response regulator [Candidatus Cloacimonadota bacterium]